MPALGLDFRLLGLLRDFSGKENKTERQLARGDGGTVFNPSLLSWLWRRKRQHLEQKTWPGFPSLSPCSAIPLLCNLGLVDYPLCTYASSFVIIT